MSKKVIGDLFDPASQLDMAMFTMVEMTDRIALVKELMKHTSDVEVASSISSFSSGFYQKYLLSIACSWLYESIEWWNKMYCDNDNSTFKQKIDGYILASNKNKSSVEANSDWTEWLAVLNDTCLGKKLCRIRNQFSFHFEGATTNFESLPKTNHAKMLRAIQEEELEMNPSRPQYYHQLVIDNVLATILLEDIFNKITVMQRITEVITRAFQFEKTNISIRTGYVRI